MRAAIAELEAALQAGASDEALAVYADALQAAGDPRGELIALELHATRHGTTAELDAERTGRLRGWLGNACGGRMWRLGDVRRGCVMRFVGDVERILALLASPAAAYLERVHIRDDTQPIEDALAMLASAPRPWLRRLTLDRRGNDTRPLPHDLLERLTGAAPRRDELVVAGTDVIAAPGVLALRKLRLVNQGAYAIATGALRHVHELTLGTAGESWRAQPHVSEELFPALRRLDVSGNECGDWYRPDAVSMYPLVHAADLSRLAQLRLPSLEASGDLEHLAAVLDRYPALAVEIARVFATSLAAPSHPRLRVPDAPVPWPPHRGLGDGDRVSFDPPGTRVLLSELVKALEADYDDLGAATREAWHALWSVVAGMEPTQERDGDRSSAAHAFDAATLARAFDIFEATTPALGNVELRDVRAGATVKLRRWWG